jgi:multiple sugar transport system permease protein
MKSRISLTRSLVYVALLMGCCLFAFPLIWMLLTSLKPIEQTMTYPPQWIPTANFIEVDGRSVEVTRDLVVEEPAALVELLVGFRAGERQLISASEYDASSGVYRLVQMAEPGWVLVTERSETKIRRAGLLRMVVPPEQIQSQVTFRWDNYRKALASMGGRSVEEVEGSVTAVGSGPDSVVSFWTFVGNTLFVCILGVVGTVLSNAIIAYGFARVRWRGRDVFFALTLATMMIPFPVLMVPLYGVFASLGWIGTLLPLWVPAWFGSAFTIFLMRQFFRTIPEELSEAARIDGCSEWRIFWKVILPLSKPVLAVAALFHFLHAWNDFLGPLLYLTRRSTFTLSLALQNYQSQHGGVEWHLLMAASAVTVLPVVVLFFFAQKTFIQGIATTGSKG